MKNKKPDAKKGVMEKVIDICKKRGFVFPSAEIYGGLSGFYDYGPLGTKLKSKIEASWRDCFMRSEDNMWEISSRTIAPTAVWQASGHLKDFVDPITQCEKCKSMFRADNLIEEDTGKFVEGMKPEELTKIIRESKIKCPKCGDSLGEVRIFNLMLKTNVGPLESLKGAEGTENSVAYLRPETAQGAFTNFKNMLVSTRAKLPFGVVQFGISYRNEISPRQWLIRLREFNQIEIEMFVNPKKINDCPLFENVSKRKVKILTREDQKVEREPKEATAEEAVKKGIVPNKWMAYFIAKELEWYKRLGIPLEALRHRHMLEAETPHYSRGNFDMEIKFDFGWKEVVGNAYRTDFDLQTHMKHAGVDFSVVEDESGKAGEKIVPHVIEPSFGVDRTIYAVLLYCFREGKERGWSWFAFPPKIAPFTVAVFPLVSKEGLPEKAKEVHNQIKQCYDCFYDESGSIGKRYARADEAGIPWCITIDYESLKGNDVTLRDRDSTKQIRVKIKDLASVIWKLMNEDVKFEKMGKQVK